MGDRYNIQSQLEHLQSKQIGTGHPDTEPHEWLVNQHRDTYCTYEARQDLLSYMAVAEGESKARLRYNHQRRLVQPCGIKNKTGAPADDDDEESTAAAATAHN